jgi:hypothetical protein
VRDADLAPAVRAAKPMSALADLRGFAPIVAQRFAPNLERLKSTRNAAGRRAAWVDACPERAQALTVLSDRGAVQLSSHSGQCYFTGGNGKAGDHLPIGQA